MGPVATVRFLVAGVVVFAACGGVVAQVGNSDGGSVNGTSAGSTTGTGPGGGSACVALADCCVQLPVRVEASCDTVLASMNSSDCSAILSEIEGQGYCDGPATGTGPGTGTGTTAGASTGGGASTGTDDGGEGDASADDAGSDDDSGPSCPMPPEHVYAETVAGVYCPFSAPPGGKNVACQSGQQCCETPAAANVPSTCVVDGTVCPIAGSTAWQCDGPLDCASSSSGSVCCGIGSIETAAACGMVPPFPYVSGANGSVCQAQCATQASGQEEFQVCSQDSDCPASASNCVAIAPKGVVIGYCSP